MAQAEMPVLCQQPERRATDTTEYGGCLRFGQGDDADGFQGGGALPKTKGSPAGATKTGHPTACALGTGLERRPYEFSMPTGELPGCSRAATVFA